MLTLPFCVCSGSSGGHGQIRLLEKVSPRPQPNFRVEEEEESIFCLFGVRQPIDADPKSIKDMAYVRVRLVSLELHSTQDIKSGFCALLLSLYYDEHVFTQTKVIEKTFI